MDKTTIQEKKEKLEAEFIKVEEQRKKSVEITAQCTQDLMRLQGAYAQLVELEKELEGKGVEKAE